LSRLSWRKRKGFYSTIFIVRDTDGVRDLLEILKYTSDISEILKIWMKVKMKQFWHAYKTDSDSELPDMNTEHRRGKHQTNTYENEVCSSFPSDWAGIQGGARRLLVASTVCKAISELHLCKP
jgi:hypothetical protein